MNYRDEGPEWRVAAGRLSPLVDGEEYYPALRDALIGARKQIFIVGWDLHTEVLLLRGDAAEEAARESEWPIRLADLLLALVRERADLHIRLLIWEGSPLFVFERQHIPRMHWPWAKHPRIEIVWDRDTPRLSSHHQKFVVIDGAMAFAGGMDLTSGRWDTHAHHREDPRRKTPGLFAGEGQPYHDIMLALDGEAARTLGGWARERWLRATGERVSPCEIEVEADSHWPVNLKPVFRDQEVEIALTQPLYGGRPEKRQVESTYLAQIAAARRLIYIESQYLTCAPIVDALCDRLREQGGPEVIIILPWGCPGSLQAMSMDPRRDELLDRLRDTGGRVQAYWATLRGGELESIACDAVYIHAKTLVIDDRMMRVGSANLNNRSMGLDTELDLSIWLKDGDEAGARAIRDFRRRLMAYLLGVDVDAVSRAEAETGSVVGAIEALRGGERTLHPFAHRATPLQSSLVLPRELSDPDRPLDDIDADRVLRVIAELGGGEPPLRRPLYSAIGMLKRRRGGIIALGCLLALIALWALSPLRGLIDSEALQTSLERIRSSPAGAAGVTLAFALLATAGVPVSMLATATGAVFSVALALPVCLAATTLSAYLSFSAGQFAPDRLRAFISGRMPEELERRLSNLSVLGVVILRHIPVAPFAIVNLACGLVGVPRGRFLAGTALGMLPGMLMLAWLGQETVEVLLNPGSGGAVKLAAIAAFVIGMAFAAERVLRRYDPDSYDSSGAGAE
ncbi:MAG: VTT domain-containing protein [Candidatus Hydrogenedentes bacterium]|nr:VTT domain-containing protein [Candidatus Hydrogenedentota bacterium]